MARPSGEKLIIDNRRARHEYHLSDRVEAGVVLMGTEVKSLRGGEATFKQAYAEVRDGEAWLVGLHVLTGLLPAWMVLADASMLIAFSIFCFGAAIWRHLNPGPPPPRPDVRRIPPAMLIVVSSFLALVSFAALM